MKLSALICVVVLLAVPAASSAELRIATYNIENYTAADRMTPQGYRHGYPKPEEEKIALRAVIRAMDADILILQEVGPEPYLRELQRDLSKEGLNYPVAQVMEAADPVRHIAVMMKRAYGQVRFHTDLDFAYFGQRESVKRGLLELVIPRTGGAVTLWAMHLKSRYTNRKDDPESALRRGREAMAIRDYILEKSGNPMRARFLILGDFNDHKSSGPLRYLTEIAGRRISVILPSEDSRAERWTYRYLRQDSYDRVDYVLASPGLLPDVVLTRVYDGPKVLEASDHRPVLVTLRWSEAAQTKAANNQMEAKTSALNKSWRQR